MARRRGLVRGYLGLRLVSACFKRFETVLRPF